MAFFEQLGEQPVCLFGLGVERENAPAERCTSVGFRLQ